MTHTATRDKSPRWSRACPAVRVNGEDCPTHVREPTTCQYYANLEASRLDPMALQQLIYNSTAGKDFSETHLAFLLLNARKNNQALGVTGLLLYDAGAFLQVLEGEGATLEGLYRRIRRDPRHVRVSTLLSREVDTREFGEWSMGFVATTDIATALPGYSDYLQHRGDTARAGALAARVIAQFRAGQYRQHVER